MQNLYSVISFSVINYVVSMRCPRGSDDSSFFIYTPVYIKNELGLEESGLSNPSQFTYRMMVKTVDSGVLEASLIVPPLRRSIWRERLSPTPVPALPLVVKNGTKSCS